MTGARHPPGGTPAAEVLVVGGGPAGSVLAALLAGRGREVLLVERHRFPRPKACGECLNPGAVLTLARLGLLDRLLELGPVPLEGWSLRTPDGHTARGRFPEGAPALGVDRGTFDAALLREARRRGVRIREGVHVQDVVRGGSGGPVRIFGRGAGGAPFEAVGSILVGADGLRSVVARKSGSPPRPPRLRKASLSWRIGGRGPSRGRGRLLLGGATVVGLAPVPGPAGTADLWNGTLVVDGRSRASRLARDGWNVFREALGSMGLEWTEEPAIVDGPWASGPFDRPVATPVVGRVLLVGDAAGYFDPLTGQGIFRAIRGAEIAAGVIDQALPSHRPRAPGREGWEVPVDRDVLARYHPAAAGAFAPGRWLQRAVDLVVRRPALRNPAFSFLEARPAATSALIRLTGDLAPWLHPRSPEHTCER